MRGGNGEFDVPEFVDHVALWMPMFVRVIPVDFYELFEDGCPTAGTFDCKPGRVMEMAVDLTGVLVIAILRSKDGWTNRASEMLDVKLHVQGGDIASSEGSATFGTDKTQALEVIGLTEWILRFSIGRTAVDREEFASNHLATILTSEAVEMVDGAESSDELAGHRLPTFCTGLARAGSG